MKLKDISIHYSAILVMILIIIPILIFTFVSNYINLKNDILKNTEIAVNQSRGFVLSSIKNTEKTYEFVSGYYDQVMIEGLTFFHSEYEKHRGDLSQIKMQQMKKNITT